MIISPSVEAVFERGVFRPVVPIHFSIPEGKRLKIHVETESYSNDVLELASRVYDGLSEQEIDEIEQIALDRTHFFNKGTRTE